MEGNDILDAGRASNQLKTLRLLLTNSQAGGPIQSGNVHLKDNVSLHIIGQSSDLVSRDAALSRQEIKNITLWVGSQDSKLYQLKATYRDQIGRMIFTVQHTYLRSTGKHTVPGFFLIKYYFFFKVAKFWGSNTM